jgi:ABC-2 type transport system permease protein
MITVLIKKELSASLHSPLTHAVLATLVAGTGLVYWFSSLNIFYRGEISLELFFRVLEYALLLLVPPLAMKSIAHERKAGTLDLLLSKPVQAWEIIGGKCLAILLQVTFFLAITLIYYITILFLGDVDPAIGWCGYLGLLLLAGCYTSICLFASSLTHDALVALLHSVFLLGCLQFLFHLVADWGEGTLVAPLFHFLALDEHFRNISRGIIDTRDLIYFGSVIFLFLFLTRHHAFRSKS